MLKAFKIPEATIQRLSIYSRFLLQLMNEGEETVSSGQIAQGVGVSSAQVRKDLAYFGEFGTRGVGYRVDDLYGYLMEILGLNHKWNVIIVGAGKLGSALAIYQGFKERGFIIKAVLDVAEDKINTQIGELHIEHVDVLKEKVKEHDVHIGVVTVPANEAQKVTDELVEAGVGAILNFSPRMLMVPPETVLRNVDLSVNLEVLSFNLSQNK